MNVSAIGYIHSVRATNSSFWHHRNDSNTFYTVKYTEFGKREHWYWISTWFWRIPWIEVLLMGGKSWIGTDLIKASIVAGILIHVIQVPLLFFSKPWIYYKSKVKDKIWHLSLPSKTAHISIFWSDAPHWQHNSVFQCFPKCTWPLQKWFIWPFSDPPPLWSKFGLGLGTKWLL